MFYSKTAETWVKASVQTGARNKKSITLDLRLEEGQEVVRRLAEVVDIIIENFRPGTIEKWGLGYESLKKINPGLIMVRISGYGQDGPYRDKPGFGFIGEAMGGLRYFDWLPRSSAYKSWCEYILFVPYMV